MKQEKYDFDYWKEIYRSVGITLYLRKPISPNVFSASSLGIRDSGVYEVSGLRMKVLAARKDMSEILFQLSDREGKTIMGKAEKGMTLDEMIFKSAYCLEGKRDLMVLGVYGANASVEIPSCVVSPIALSWKIVRGADEHFKIIHLFPKTSECYAKIENLELTALT